MSSSPAGPRSRPFWRGMESPSFNIWLCAGPLGRSGPIGSQSAYSDESRDDAATGGGRTAMSSAFAPSGLMQRREASITTSASWRASAAFWSAIGRRRNRPRRAVIPSGGAERLASIEPVRAAKQVPKQASAVTSRGWGGVA